MDKKPKILLGLPTMGNMNTMLVAVLLKWIAEAATTGKYNLAFYPTYKVVPVDVARNHIVKQFLMSDCTHLFFIDADTVPPEDAITKLLAVNQPVVTGLTPILEYDEARKSEESNGFYKKWNAVDAKTDEHVKPNTGIVKVVGAGSSCILIRREVFKRLPAPWYRFIYQDADDKVVTGEDVAFIAKARDIGFNCYADTSVICGHDKSIIW